MSLIGFILIQAPFDFDVEEKYGLQWLFWLRGAQPTPAEVVIVGIDRHSGRTLDLPEEPDDWPRSTHAELIRKLSGACAQAIVFDLYFAENRSHGEEDEDTVLADAIHDARNTALVAHLGLREDGKAASLRSTVEEVHMPAAALEKVAAAVAPFPLPNAPSDVTGYWIFKTSAGDIPTLPTVAFQIYALQAYDEFRALLETAHAAGFLGLPANENEILATQGITDLVERLRNLFKQDPELAERVRIALYKMDDVSAGPQVKQIVESLLNLYQSDDWQYLNFYGPPRAVRTVSYADVLQLQESIDCRVERTYAGKVVFVGASELSPVEQKDKDAFDTVFSQPTGLKLSGVEIAATATANLIEGRPIRRLEMGSGLYLVLAYGLIISVAWRSLATLRALSLTLAIMGTYAGTAFYQFTFAGLWYPLTTPLLQSLVAIVLALARNRNEVEVRAADIRRALKDWLPPVAIEQVINVPGSVKRTCGLLYGTCLHTDLESFTALSERVEPMELSLLMDEYFRTIGQPVTLRGGFVSDQMGDTMLAIWAAPEPDITLRKQACEGALDIADAVLPMSKKTDRHLFSTRIGLHAGRIAVGTFSEGTAGQSRSFGLIVNTTQRIQALNKVLRTRILVSEEVIEDLSRDFILRPVGNFTVAGLLIPLAIYELLGRKQNHYITGPVQASPSAIERSQAPDLTWLCAAFAGALEEYRNMKWQTASERFVEILDAYPGDGPSHFYLRRAEFYRHHPPDGAWDSTIRT